MATLEPELGWPEQRMLFLALRQAVGKARDTILHRLWVANSPLVDRFVGHSLRKDRGSGGLLQLHAGDLWHDCHEALRKHLEQFDIDRGVEFRRYMWPYFKGERTKLLKREKRRRDRAFGELSDNPRWIEVIAPLVDPSSEGEEDIQPRNLEHLKSRLPEEFIREGGWEAFLALLGDPQGAGPANRWRARLRMKGLAENPRRTERQESKLVTSDTYGPAVARRWKLWNCLVLLSRTFDGLDNSAVGNHPPVSEP